MIGKFNTNLSSVLNFQNPTSAVDQKLWLLSTIGEGGGLRGGASQKSFLWDLLVWVLLVRSQKVWANNKVYINNNLSRCVPLVKWTILVIALVFRQCLLLTLSLIGCKLIHTLSLVRSFISLRIEEICLSYIVTKS